MTCGDGSAEPTAKRRLILFCATQRGLSTLKRIAESAQDWDICVASFPEYPGEPRYLLDIQEYCKLRGFEFWLDSDIKARGWEAIANPRIDLILAISWRYILPESFFSQATLGAFAFHDSLLPRYRGFSPTVWSLINGESRCGMTLFRIAATVDSGEILAQQEIPISQADDIGTLRERGTEAVLALLDRQLPALLRGEVQTTPQDESLATYTCKWTPEDAKIDWSADSQSIYNLIRATTRPYTGAFCKLGDKKITVWKAELVGSPPRYVTRIPGRVVEIGNDKSATVLTGDSVLRLLEVSLDDGEPVPASTLLKHFSTTLT